MQTKDVEKERKIVHIVKHSLALYLNGLMQSQKGEEKEKSLRYRQNGRKPGPERSGTTVPYEYYFVS